MLNCPTVPGRSPARWPSWNLSKYFLHSTKTLSVMSTNKTVAGFFSPMAYFHMVETRIKLWEDTIGVKWHTLIAFMFCTSKLWWPIIIYKQIIKTADGRHFERKVTIAFALLSQLNVGQNKGRTHSIRRIPLARELAGLCLSVRVCVCVCGLCRARLSWLTAGSLIKLSVWWPTEQ